MRLHFRSGNLFQQFPSRPIESLHQSSIKKPRRLIAAFAVAVLSLALFTLHTESKATTLDFNSEFSRAYFPGESITESGFTFTQVGLPGDAFFIGTGSSCTPVCADDGTQWLGEFANSNQAFLVSTQTSGNPFSLANFDGAETFVGIQTSWAQNILMIGTLAGGGIVSASFALDWINDGPGGSADFQTFTLPATFTNLTSVEFIGAGGVGNNNFIIDNVLVNAVPEPSSLVLMSLALAGIGLMPCAAYTLVKHCRYHHLYTEVTTNV